VVGATVEFRWLEKTEDGDLTAWIDGRKKNRSVATKGFRPSSLGLPGSVKTDKEGRFTLTGLGRERVVSLWIKGPGISQAHIWALSRNKGVEGLRTGYYGTYAATFDFLAKPSKPIVGTVTDRKTGQRLAGITVGSFRWVNLWTKTDDKGHYRLDGVPKDGQYTVSAGGMGYHNATHLQVADTPGLAPLTVDFALDRGVIVRGRLLDKAGKPVRGFVHFAATPDNPHRKDFASFGKPQALVAREGDTKEDGSFEVLAIPGPGALLATADDTDGFVRLPPGKVNLGNLILEGHHAVVPINVPEANPKAVFDVLLERGRKLAGKVVGPDGKPLAGAVVAGRSGVAILTFGRGPDPLPGSSFTVGGLGAKQGRTLIAVYPQKKLAAIHKLRGDEKGPVTLWLEPTGGLVGRVLGGDGKPRGELAVRVEVGYDQLVKQKLPVELRFEYPQWSKILNAETTTDKEGRFRVGSLVPGLKYRVQVWDGEPGKGVVVYAGEVPPPEPGKTKDLGDLKAKARK
jgi:hypothetical protein